MRWYIFFIVSNGGHAASRPPCRSNASSLSRDTSPDTNKTKHGTQATTRELTSKSRGQSKHHREDKNMPEA